MHYLQLQLFLHGTVLGLILQNILAMMYLYVLGETHQSKMCGYHCTAL